jgi:hypothetical protein
LNLKLETFIATPVPPEKAVPPRPPKYAGTGGGSGGKDDVTDLEIIRIWKGRKEN